MKLKIRTIKQIARRLIGKIKKALCQMNACLCVLMSRKPTVIRLKRENLS